MDNKPHKPNPLPKDYIPSGKKIKLHTNKFKQNTNEADEKLTFDQLLAKFGLTGLDEKAKKYVIDDVFKEIFPYDQQQKCFTINNSFFKDKKTRLFGEETQELKDIKTKEDFITHIKSINSNLYIDRYNNNGKTDFAAINMFFKPKEFSEHTNTNMENIAIDLAKHLSGAIVREIFLDQKSEDNKIVFLQNKKKDGYGELHKVVIKRINDLYKFEQPITKLDDAAYKKIREASFKAANIAAHDAIDNRITIKKDWHNTEKTPADIITEIKAILQKDKKPGYKDKTAQYPKKVFVDEVEYVIKKEKSIGCLPGFTGLFAQQFELNAYNQQNNFIGQVDSILHRGSIFAAITRGNQVVPM